MYYHVSEGHASYTVNSPRPNTTAMALHLRKLRLIGQSTVPKTGNIARVKKKFQWTPYSVTCSCSSATYLNQKHVLTGYSTPLTMMTLTRPSRISGVALYNDRASFLSRL